MSNAHIYSEITAELQADARDAQLAVTCPDCGAERFSCSACDGEGGYWEYNNDFLQPDDWIDCGECEGSGLRLECEECGHQFGA